MGPQIELVVHFGFKPASHPSSSDASFLLDFRGRLAGVDFFQLFCYQPGKGCPISGASK